MSASKDSITSEDVRRILGDLEDAKILAILATGANIEQVEEAAAWLAREDDVMGELERPLAGVVAQIYDIVLADDEFGEDER